MKIIFDNLIFKRSIPRFKGKYHRCCFVKICFTIIMLPLFQIFIMLLIIFNTVTLALDQYPVIDDTLNDVFTRFNYFFTAMFAIEAGLKFIGLGLWNFIRDKFNIFDAVVVVTSLIELGFSGGSGGGISALRAFRLFRIVKLARTMESLKLLIDSIAHTLAAIANFTILLGLFIYVYSLLGM